MIRQFRFTSKRFFKFNLNNFSEKIRKDYYQILGVSKDATDDQIKTAYRTLAKKYHPDVSIGKNEEYEPSAEKFRDIAEAYAVLSDKSLRLNYDTSMRNNPNAIYNAEKYSLYY
jgi:curved DNA-binding protein CbpA